MSRGRKSLPGPPPLPAPRRRRRPPALARLVAQGAVTLGLALALVLAGGCKHTSIDKDPLVGGPPIPDGPIPAPVPTNASARGASEGPPPLTPAPGGTTPVALTTGSQAGPTAADAHGSPASSPGATGGTATSTGPSGALLHAPETTGSNAGASSLTSPGGNGGVTLTGGTGADSYDDIQRQLKACGVTFQQLTHANDSDEWTFTCFIPKPGSTQRRFEGREVGGNGIPAMRNVLMQIKQDK